MCSCLATHPLLPFQRGRGVVDSINIYLYYIYLVATISYHYDDWMSRQFEGHSSPFKVGAVLSNDVSYFENRKRSSLSARKQKQMDQMKILSGSCVLI